MSMLSLSSASAVVRASTVNKRRSARLQDQQQSRKVAKISSVEASVAPAAVCLSDDEEDDPSELEQYTRTLDNFHFIRTALQSHVKWYRALMPTSAGTFRAYFTPPFRTKFFKDYAQEAEFRKVESELEDRVRSRVSLWFRSPPKEIYGFHNRTQCEVSRTFEELNWAAIPTLAEIIELFRAQAAVCFPGIKIVVRSNDSQAALQRHRRFNSWDVGTLELWYWFETANHRHRALASLPESLPTSDIEFNLQRDAKYARLLEPSTTVLPAYTESIPVEHSTVWQRVKEISPLFRVSVELYAAVWSSIQGGTYSTPFRMHYGPPNPTRRAMILAGQHGAQDHVLDFIWQHKSELLFASCVQAPRVGHTLYNGSSALRGASSPEHALARTPFVSSPELARLQGESQPRVFEVKREPGVWLDLRALRNGSGVARELMHEVLCCDFDSRSRELPNLLAAIYQRGRLLGGAALECMESSLDSLRSFPAVILNYIKTFHCVELFGGVLLPASNSEVEILLMDPQNQLVSRPALPEAPVATLPAFDQVDIPHELDTNGFVGATGGYRCLPHYLIPASRADQWRPLYRVAPLLEDDAPPNRYCVLNVNQIVPALYLPLGPLSEYNLEDHTCVYRPIRDYIATLRTLHPEMEDTVFVMVDPSHPDCYYVLGRYFR